MYVSAEQIAATRKAGMDALISLAQAQFAAFEQVSALNFNTGKAVLEGGINHAKAFMSAKRAQDLVQLNQAAAQPLFDKAIAYSRDLNAVVAQARAEVFRASEARAIEANRAVIKMLDDMTKTPPAGLGVPVITIKSVLAATSAACENYAGFAQQAADMAKANISCSTAAKVTKAGKRKAA
jgi:phasin family protein